MNNKSKKIYIFDLDGVLIDISERIKAVLDYLGLNPYISPSALRGEKKRRFWKYFLSDMFLDYDRPRRVGIELLLDRLKKGIVVIVSGRPTSLKEATLRELKEFNVPVDKIKFFFRGLGDYRREKELKLHFFKIISNMGEIVEVHDDSAEVLDAIWLINPKIKLYLHYDNSYKEYSPGIIME